MTTPAGIRIDGPSAESSNPEPWVASEPSPPPLFDVETYVVDRQIADTLTITFSGSISFEANDVYAQELFNSLALGRDVTLQVGGAVAAKSGRYKRDSEGNETITGVASVKVETMLLPSPEQLSS